MSMTDTPLTEIPYGNHTHKVEECEPYQIGGKTLNYRSVQEPCETCAVENDVFMLTIRMAGAYATEEKMRSNPTYQAYHQHWPFDAKKKVLSKEALEEDEDNKHFQGDFTNDYAGAVLDNEAVQERLSELTPRQREVIILTGEAFRPRDIAKLWGEPNSNRVRQDKYAALRLLGAPVNQNMRRN